MDTRKTSSRMFTVLVCGEDPESLLSAFDMKKKVETHVKYRYLDAAMMRDNSVKLMTSLIEDPKRIGLSETQILALRERISALKSMSPFEYYTSLTSGMFYDDDGNALTDENPNGKWYTASVGGNFSNPFILKNGEKTYQARINDIDWDAMNTGGRELFTRTWELMVESSEPRNDDERKIVENFTGIEKYFSNFKNKESYVRYSTLFWTYAFLDEGGWHDLDMETESCDKWIEGFMERFILKIEGNQLLTIYECSTNDDSLVV